MALETDNMKSETAPPTVDGAKAFHVAIIMDGNGRWAKKRHQPRGLGHKAGVDALKRTIRAAVNEGITHLTVYAFSTENWKRPQAEVNDLMGLLKAFIRADLAQLLHEGVRVRIVGDVETLPPDIKACVLEAEETTKNNTAFNLQVALNYGARHDMVMAVRQISQKVAAGEIAPEAIDERLIDQALSTRQLPPLDLLIRTSGEMRLSNFLLWEAAYAEFVFQDILWPDYGPEALKDALKTYATRERRFGAVGEAMRA